MLIPAIEHATFHKLPPNTKAIEKMNYSKHVASYENYAK
jgi:hypothetical protein